MANVSKPVCKYGSSCYRKNPQHLRAYSHPNPEENEVCFMHNIPGSFGGWSMDYII